MSKYSKEDVVRVVKEEDAEFIRLQLTGISDMLKNMAITSSQLSKTLRNRCMFDGSATEGLVRTDGSDIYLYPDLNVFEILPWRPRQDKVVRLIRDMYNPDDTAFAGDPRSVLKRAAKKVRGMGFVFNVEPECEFFLSHTDEEGRPTTNTCETTGYFNVSPIDLTESVRRSIMFSLGEMDFEMETSHHEIVPAQHEIDLQYTDAFCAADSVMTSKMVTKTITKHHDLHATLVPKSKGGANGSDMHINVSLSDVLGENLFVDDIGAPGPSATAYYFMAGIPRHMKPMAILVDPPVNSYKRLISGYDAPIYIVWSPTSNRSSLAYISSPKGGGMRIKLRCPDSTANPYLVLAACLRAGLDRVEKEMALPACMEGSIFIMEPEGMGSRNVKRTPETLGNIIEAYEGNSFIKGVLEEHVYTRYLEAKEKEWRDFRIQMMDWEISKYLYKYRLLILNEQRTWRRDT